MDDTGSNVASPSTAVTPDRPGRPARTYTGRVLVVDDAQFLCEGLRRVLRVADYDILSANDGAQALNLARQIRFDAVITDLHMPNMSGEELLAALAKGFPQLPCIVITGHATRERITKVARMPNVKTILIKPLDQQRLLKVLSEAIGGDTAPETAPVPLPAPAPSEAAEADSSASPPSTKAPAGTEATAI